MTKALARMWALTMLAMLPTSLLMAQSATKATVQISKSVNGQEETQTQEFVLEEGQTIQDILQELDLLDEFGQLKGGQAFEISIKKTDAMGGTQDIDLAFSPTVEFINKAFLGVYLRESDNDVAGAQITSIIDDTAAEEVGLKERDIITQVNGQDIAGVSDLVYIINNLYAGDKIKLTINRDGKKKKENVTLGNRPYKPAERIFFNGGEDVVIGFPGDVPPPPPAPVFPDNEDIRFFSDTVIFAPFDMEDGQTFEIKTEERAFLGVSPSHGWYSDESPNPPVGFEIGRVVEGSSAETMGLLEEDIMTSFNGEEVQDFGHLADLIDACEPGQEVKITVLRDGKKKNITGEIGMREYCTSTDQDFMIFHDLKGMDEDGNLFYNYDFEFDGDAMEELRMGLQQLGEGMEELHEEWPQIQEDIRLELEGMKELGFLFQEEGETMDISIVIADITEEELTRINENAEIALRTENDLELDAISFFPNPTLGEINLAFTASGTEAQQLEIRLYDQASNSVYRESQSGFTGRYEGVIDISSEAAGTYYLQIVCGDTSYSRKVIKKS
ncbi:MAG: PDZ domain-containing protein [Flavobacteriales bacterium]